VSKKRIITIKKIKKRSGKIVAFSVAKIKRAIRAGFKAGGNYNLTAIDKVTTEVLDELEKRFNSKLVPEVEQVQDLIELTLQKDGFDKAHDAFKLYRELHRKERDISALVDSDELTEKYLGKDDWRVKENANMTYSLQGLNNHVASIISANFWLNRLYSREARKAHLSGDIHIHDLSSLSAYCSGWDLKDLLIRGFGGVPGKVNSAPPKHLSTALGQLVNFFYTLQGEVAGAVAVSNFDTYMAPFIRSDKLTFKQVKQLMQEFVYNMNVPTRVGFQCMSQDTEILGIDGWKKYDEVEVGDTIKTFNVETGEIEDKKVRKIFRKKYKGIMYNLKNRISDQLISPKHRVVRKVFNSDKYNLEAIEDVMKLKSPFIVPVAGDNVNKDVVINDEQIKLMAWIITEGTIERPGKHRCCYRVSIYQSKEVNGSNYDEIKSLLDYYKLKYSEYEQHGLGKPVMRFRLDASSSKLIHNWFSKDNIKFVPEILINMSQKQSKLFLKTYLKADGFEGSKIATSLLNLVDDLQQIACNAGWGSTVSVRKPTIGKKDIYVIRLIKHKETYIQKVKKIEYEGVIWCPNTENETVIARRNGKVFITGNTPFTNVTMDLVPSGIVANEVVIIGGKPIKAKYKDYQKEIDMFNKAFAEVMMAGDSQGRVFTFPIPTYSITKDFDWDNPNLEPVWEMTRKYGIPYFSNYINSDMNPDDTRSMCPLSASEKVLIKSSRGRGLEYSKIGYICEGGLKNGEHEIYSDGKFVKGRFSKFTNQEMYLLKLVNGHEIRMSSEHENFVLDGEKQMTLRTKELKEHMYLPYSLNKYEGEGGNYDLGFFVGAFAGDGSFDRDTNVVFSLENNFKKSLVLKLKQIAKDYFGAGTSEKADKNTQLYTLKVHSRAAVGLCRDFVVDKKRQKRYRARLFGASLKFRKGVFDGHYATDGGNRNRIYTSSKKMVQSLNMLAATMGTTTSIYEDDRQGRLGTEPNWAVLFYKLNRQKYGNVWKKQNGKLWVKIESIKRIGGSVAYCFEVKNDTPMFTVGTTGILTHNCRLRLDNKVLRKRGGIFAANPLTGSIGVVTINLARLGYLCAKEKGRASEKAQKEFYRRLGELMDVAKDSLITKRERVEKFTETGLYPYCKYYLSEVYKRNGVYWRNHFNTIGLNGMNEALLNLMGVGIGIEEGRTFALDVMDYMREKLLIFQRETGELFNLEASPAEGATHRFARLDKQRYPDIRTAADGKLGESEWAAYYTNSTQLPVDFTRDIFEALDAQDELQCKYTGGTVFHGFLGEALPDTKVTKALVKKVAENYKLPYFSITPTFSICPKHGYIAGEHEYCPKCDEEIGWNKKLKIKQKK